MNHRDRRLGRAATLVACCLGLWSLLSCRPSASPEVATPEPSSTAHRHSVAGETCFICDETKRDTDRLWCTEHGRYEDRCWICQPQLEDPARPYCSAHFLYEDECFLCHPELGEEAPADGAGDDDGPSGTSSKAGEASSELFCHEHGVAERECGICQPQLAERLLPGQSLKVRFSSARSASRAGVEAAHPAPVDARPSIRGLCETRYDQNTLVHVSPLTAGIVRRVAVDLGEVVRAGDVLVELHSAEVAEAKATLLSAIVERDSRVVERERARRLYEGKASAERELLAAESAARLAELGARTARQRLLNQGLTEEEIAAVERDQDTSALVNVRAPRSGSIVRREAVVGEIVAAGEPLLTLVDLSRVWLELSISADRAALLEEGLSVEARFQDLPGIIARGEIDWIDPGVDERTRRLQARVVASNPDERLRAGLYGEVSILLSQERRAVRVPRDAVQTLEGLPFVFVRLEPDLYALRRVEVASLDGAFVDVLGGLAADELVVVRGSFVVLSRFLESRLGAGCVDD